MRKMFRTGRPSPALVRSLFHARRSCDDISWLIGWVIRPYVGRKCGYKGLSRYKFMGLRAPNLYLLRPFITPLTYDLGAYNPTFSPTYILASAAGMKLRCSGPGAPALAGSPWSGSSAPARLHGQLRYDESGMMGPLRNPVIL